MTDFYLGEFRYNPCQAEFVVIPKFQTRESV
ncbi:hypothetical protein SRABI84_01257 [Peribacillus simplex]|nr:hypothetical protein SRABI84_01257 [Peribacillus simplex]